MQQTERRQHEARALAPMELPAAATVDRGPRTAPVVGYDWDSLDRYATEWVIPDEPATGARSGQSLAVGGGDHFL